jgi:hypothetical protein
VGTEKRREKVVVLRELQRAIIYTRELSKQVTEGHVSTVSPGHLTSHVVYPLTNQSTTVNGL